MILSKAGLVYDQVFDLGLFSFKFIKKSIKSLWNSALVFLKWVETALILQYGSANNGKGYDELALGENISLRRTCWMRSPPLKRATDTSTGLGPNISIKEADQKLAANPTTKR